MSLLLTLLCFWQEPWRVGDQLLLDEGPETRWLDLTKGSSRQLAGERIAAYGVGVWLQRGDSWYHVSFADGEQQAVPAPPDTPQRLVLPMLERPALLGLTHLLVLEGRVWRRLPLPTWYSYRAPRPVPGSRFGVTSESPDLFDWQDRLWIYQAKEGALHLPAGPDQPSLERSLTPRLVPLRAGGRLLWIDKGRLLLNRETPDFAVAKTLPVANLTRHSLVVLVEEGLWLLTFSDGFRDALKSWDKGSVPVTAVYVTLPELRAEQVDLGDLPVAFSLTTSDSGSPKLEVTPQFATHAVRGRNLLALCMAHRLLWWEPAGRQGSTPLEIPWAQVLLVRPRGLELEALALEGIQGVSP